MKLNRRNLRKMILKEMADMTQGEKALRGHLQGLPYEPDTISRPGGGPDDLPHPYDYNLGDRDIFDNLDPEDDEYPREDFDSEVQAALDKLVAAGLLGRSTDGYYVADPDVIKTGHETGHIDISDY